MVPLDLPAGSVSTTCRRGRGDGISHLTLIAASESDYPIRQLSSFNLVFFVCTHPHKTGTSAKKDQVMDVEMTYREMLVPSWCMFFVWSR